VRKDDIFQFANSLEGTDVKRVFIAGGMVCGKAYNDIQLELRRFEYIKIQIPA